MIRIRNLRHAYPVPGAPPATVLSIPELTLEQGKLAAVSGPSGSGKTTLLLLIGGMVRPSEGEIWVGDLPVHGLPTGAADRFRAACVGFVFQNFNLVRSLTVEENLLLASAFGPRRPRREVRAWINDLLDRVQMTQYRNRFPRQLSMGQQQRVAVARALVNRPRLILADEPTAHLDAHAAQSVVRLLMEAASETGATLLCASHDPTVLAQFEPENVVTLGAPRCAGRAAQATLRSAAGEEERP